MYKSDNMAYAHITEKQYKNLLKKVNMMWEALSLDEELSEDEAELVAEVKEDIKKKKKDAFVSVEEL